MNIQRVRDTKILNFRSARSLLSILFVCAARALLCEWRLELGGVGICGATKLNTSMGGVRSREINRN